MSNDPNKHNFRAIPTSSLRLSDVPPPSTTDWLVIAVFALSFDGYEFCGGFEACADFGNNCLRQWRAGGILPETLDGLRAFLYWEQRRWRHYQQQPDAEALAYFNAILTAIRQLLTNQEIGQAP